MINNLETTIESVGTEPIELFGFSSQEELDNALIPLMMEIKDKSGIYDITSHR